ncbi:MAG: RDD family protein, partial [Nanoarchaeota archaeon]
MSISDEFNLDLPGQKKIVLDARIGRRVTGFVLDMFFIYIFLLTPLERLITIPDVSLGEFSTIFFSLPTGLLTIVVTTAGLISVLYFSLFEYHLGYTPGMRLMGLQTLTLTFPQAVMRNLFLVPIFPFS